MANLEAQVSSAEEGMHGVQAFFTATAEDEPTAWSEINVDCVASGPLPFLLSPQRSELVIHTRTSPSFNFSASDHIGEESPRGCSLHSEQVVGLYPLESLPLRQQQQEQPQQQQDQQQQWQQQQQMAMAAATTATSMATAAAAATTTAAATTSAVLSTEATATAA